MPLRLLLRTKRSLALAALLLTATLFSTGPALLAGTVDGPFSRGDVNLDGNLDIADPIGILGFLFSGAAIPECPDAADANDDGAIDIADPILILANLFQGGGALPAPFPAIGPDPTPDALGCPILDCFSPVEVQGLIGASFPSSGFFAAAVPGGSLGSVVQSGTYATSAMNWTRNSVQLSGPLVTVTGTLQLSTPIDGTYFDGIFPTDFNCVVISNANWTYTASLTTAGGVPGAITITDTPDGSVSHSPLANNIVPSCIDNSGTATDVENFLTAQLTSSPGPESLLRNLIDAALDGVFDGQGVLICGP